MSSDKMTKMCKKCGEYASLAGNYGRCGTCRPYRSRQNKTSTSNSKNDQLSRVLSRLNEVETSMEEKWLELQGFYSEVRELKNELSLLLGNGHGSENDSDTDTDQATLSQGSPQVEDRARLEEEEEEEVDTVIENPEDRSNHEEDPKLETAALEPPPKLEDPSRSTTNHDGKEIREPVKTKKEDPVESLGRCPKPTIDDEATTKDSVTILLQPPRNNREIDGWNLEYCVKGTRNKWEVVRVERGEDKQDLKGQCSQSYMIWGLLCNTEYKVRIKAFTNQGALSKTYTNALVVKTPEV